jgi:hypothetical protein
VAAGAGVPAPHGCGGDAGVMGSSDLSVATWCDGMDASVGT